MKQSLIKQAKGLYALGRVYFASALSVANGETPNKASQRDGGYKELVIGEHGEAIRLIQRAAGSDVTKVSEKDTDGTWTTFPIHCPQIRGLEEEFSNAYNECQ